MLLHLRAGRFIAAGAWAWRRLRRLQRARGPQWRQRQAEAWTVLGISAALSGRRRLARLARRRAIARVGRAGCQALRRKLQPDAAAGLVMAAAQGEEAVAIPPTGDSRQSPLQRLLRLACEQLGAHTAAWPNRPDAFHHLAACRQALGEVDAAAAANRAALSLNPRYGEAIALREQLRHPRRPAAPGTPGKPTSGATRRAA
jgi:tetratricopeptide (TPR) repeat protein